MDRTGSAVAHFAYYLAGFRDDCLLGELVEPARVLHAILGDRHLSQWERRLRPLDLPRFGVRFAHSEFGPELPRYLSSLAAAGMALILGTPLSPLPLSPLDVDIIHDAARIVLIPDVALLDAIRRFGRNIGPLGRAFHCEPALVQVRLRDRTIRLARCRSNYTQTMRLSRV
jgi:hypothetical protein